MQTHKRSQLRDKPPKFAVSIQSDFWIHTSHDSKTRGLCTQTTSRACLQFQAANNLWNKLTLQALFTEELLLTITSTVYNPEWFLRAITLRLGIFNTCSSVSTQSVL